MKNKITEANVSMVISKTFSGLNMNALKYLLPLWMTPLSGVTIRCTFAAVAFWIIGMFTKPETSTRKEKMQEIAQWLLEHETMSRSQFEACMQALPIPEKQEGLLAGEEKTDGAEED